jgi:hypothetical protein
MKNMLILNCGKRYDGGLKMNEQFKVLKQRADEARILYKKNLITRAEANAEIIPYILAFNKQSDIIAKKYNVKPRHINFNSYIR